MCLTSDSRYVCFMSTTEANNTPTVQTRLVLLLCGKRLHIRLQIPHTDTNPLSAVQLVDGKRCGRDRRNHGSVNADWYEHLFAQWNHRAFRQARAQMDNHVFNRQKSQIRVWQFTGSRYSGDTLSQAVFFSARDNDGKDPAIATWETPIWYNTYGLLYHPCGNLIQVSVCPLSSLLQDLATCREAGR